MACFFCADDFTGFFIDGCPVSTGRKDNMATGSHRANLFPTLDHPPSPNHALKRFATAVGGIEFGAVFQPSAILSGDQRAFDRCFAVAQLKVDYLKLIIHYMHSSVHTLERASWAAFSQNCRQLATVRSGLDLFPAVSVN